MGNSMAQKPCISWLGKLRTLIVATVVIFGATLFAVTAHVQDVPGRTLLVFAAPSLTDALEALRNTIIKPAVTRLYYPSAQAPCPHSRSKTAHGSASTPRPMCSG